MKNLKFFLLGLTLLAFTGSQAQMGQYFSKYEPSKRWSVGLQLSPTALNGDADDIGIGMSGGLHVKYSFGQSFGLKLSGNIGVLKGGREEHNLSQNGDGSAVDIDDVLFVYNIPTEDGYNYKNNFKDLDITAVYTLGNISFLRPLRKVQMFTFFGFGSIWSNVEGTVADKAEAQSYYSQWGSKYLVGLDANGDETTNVASIETAKTEYVGRNFTLPFGFGVKRNFGKKLDVGLEWKTRWTRSDALDGFSFPIWRNRFTDFYHTLGLQASLKIGGQEDEESHYDWLNPMETMYADMDSMIKITEDLKELTLDDDGDGVGNFFDKENDTDCDKVYADGRAMDSDGDGVNDCKDVQPFSICPDEVDENGRSLDTDGDGVPNCMDQEPNSAADALVNANGSAVNVGGACCDCSNVSLPTIIFDNNSSRISPASYGVLYAVAEKMKSCPTLKVSATGYTTSKAGEQMAYKRSNAIIDHLEANYGIERSRINTEYTTGSGVEYSSRRIDLGEAK